MAAATAAAAAAAAAAAVVGEIGVDADVAEVGDGNGAGKQEMESAEKRIWSRKMGESGRLFLPDFLILRRNLRFLT